MDSATRYGDAGKTRAAGSRRGWSGLLLASCTALWAAAYILFSVAGPSALGQQQPAGLTPQQSELLHRVRDGVERDWEQLRGYLHTFERRSYHVNLLGKVSNGPVQTYEVQPSPFEPGRLWRRLVAVNGVRLSPERLRADEEKARREAAARLRERQQETPAARAKRLRDEREEAAKERERLADIERAFRFVAAGEDAVDGMRVLAFTMTPRSDAETTSDIGKHLQKLRGRLLVEPVLAQLVRADFETTGDITFGLGVIGWVSSGSRMLYRRGRAADGAWLPVEARFQGSGRTLMLIPFHLDTWAKYADFRPAPPANARAEVAPSPR